MRQVSVESLVQRPAHCEVCSQGFDLHQGAHNHKHVKDLVALANEVALPREQALWVRAAEEVGADQEKDHMVHVVHHHGVGAALSVAAVNAVHHRAYVQTVGQGRRHYLEELVGELGQLRTGILPVAATKAGKPCQKCCRRQKKATHHGVQLFFYHIIVVRKSAPILVDCNPYIVKEVEGVVGQL